MIIRYKHKYEDLKTNKDIIQRFDCNICNIEDINIFLNNPEKEYYNLSKKIFNYEIESSDKLEIINSVMKDKYTNIITIPTNKIIINNMIGIYDTAAVYLYKFGIRCASKSSFNLEDRDYTIKELNNLIDKEIIIPIDKVYLKVSNINNLEYIDIYNEKKDNIKYIDLENKYNDLIVNKLKNIVSINTLMKIIRIKIIDTYVNDYYIDNINNIINKYNIYAINNNIELIPCSKLDILIEAYNTLDDFNYKILYKFIEEYDLNYDEILKLKDVDINEIVYDPNQFIDELIINKNDATTAFRCLIDYKDELTNISRCKLLKVILNSNKYELINELFNNEMIIDSNVKKYVNKRNNNR